MEEHAFQMVLQTATSRASDMIVIIWSCTD